MGERYDSNEDTSSSSSSFTSSSTSWIETSDDFDVSEYNGPEHKKFKKNYSADKEYKEIDVNYNFRLRSTCKWTIKDYKLVSDKKKTGEKLESPIFTFGSNDEFKWRFELYPKGSNVQNKHFIAIYLTLVASKEPKIRTHFSFTIANSRAQNIKEIYITESFKPGQRFGIRQFISQSSLRGCPDLSDTDRLTVLCDITVELNKTPPNKRKVLDDLEMLLDSGSYSDVTLEVENKKFKVHKYILAARSPVFAAMFKHDMKEKEQNIVKITDIDYSIMEEILRFTYTGSVKNLDTTAKDLLAAADKYAFEDLKLMCENELCKSLKIDNVVDVLNFADLHSAIKLKEQSLKYFVTNVNSVINTSSFKSMAESQSPLLAQVIVKMALQKKSSY